MAMHSMRLVVLCAALAVGCTNGAPNSCPVPNENNTQLQDGVLQCSKGFHVTEIGVIDDFQNSVTLSAEHINLTTATCEGNGWKIDGFFLSGVQLTSFVCVPTPAPSRARTNIFAEFGDDPCIDERVDSAFRGLGQTPICEPGKDKKYIIRAVDADGNRITLDNEKGAIIEQWDGMWRYYFNWKNDLVFKKPIVAATCVRAGGVKCPCKPLNHLKNIGYVPNYPAIIETVGLCTRKSAWLYYDQVKAPARESRFMPDVHDTNTALVTCQAGTWMLYRDSDTNVWGVNGLSCYKK